MGQQPTQSDSKMNTSFLAPLLTEMQLLLQLLGDNMALVMS